MKLEIAYQGIIGVLVFLLELKGWSYCLQLRRLQILPANHMYSVDCCKTICSSYPKHAALEIQNGTFPGIYKASPWFLLSTVNVCWVIFEEECCQKYKLKFFHFLWYKGKVMTIEVEAKLTLKCKKSVTFEASQYVLCYQVALLAYKRCLFAIKLLKAQNKSQNSEDLISKHTLVCPVMELLLCVSAGFTF